MSVDGDFDMSGAVGISGHLFDYVDTLKDRVFLDSDKKVIHQFALAVGIASDRKLERSKFRAEGDSPEVNPGSQLATHENISAIINLLSLQGSIGDSKPSEVVSEYINGGLELLKDASFEDQTEDSQEVFLEQFPFLIEEEKSS